MTNTFFERLPEWSRWKHRILSSYLPRFVGILGSRHPTIGYIDGFAGAGRYGNPPQDGSPLIAARLATELSQQGKPYGLRCINVEPEFYDDLCAATSAFPTPLVTNLQGTFREHLPHILDLLGTQPALFFLDPFGDKGMEWEAIRQIAARPEDLKTELLINFYITKIDRDAGWIDSTCRPKTAQSFVRLLNELMGTDAWQPLVEQHREQGARMAAITDLYLGRLARTFGGFAAACPIRTGGGRLKYYIVHVTRHPRGSREMSDVVYRTEHAYDEERRRHAEASTRQLELPFESPAAPEDADGQLERNLAEAIAALAARYGRLSLGGIQDALTLTWFGQAVERHYRAACKLLLADGRLLRTADGQRIDVKTVFAFSGSTAAMASVSR